MSINKFIYIVSVESDDESISGTAQTLPTYEYDCVTVLLIYRKHCRTLIEQFAMTCQVIKYNIV